MILAASNIGWTQEEDELAIEILSNSGINAIEVAPARVFSNPLTVTKKDAALSRIIWHEHGLPIVSMQSLLYKQPALTIFGDRKDRLAFKRYIATTIKLAGALGVGPMVFGSPKNRIKGAMSFTKAKAQVVPLFREVGDLCAEVGTTFCIEANAQAYGCDFMTTLQEAADVVVDVAHPNVSMVADTGNMQMSGDSLADLEAVISTVSHIHISAPLLAPLSAQESSIRAVANLLTASGYEGIATLEMRSVDDNLVSLAESAALLTNVFQNRKR